MSPSKKTILLFLFLIIYQLPAQKYRLSIGGGPGFGMAKDTYLNFRDIKIVDGNPNEEIKSARPMSFAKGFSSHLRLEYPLNSILDIGLEATYFNGSKSTFIEEGYTSIQMPNDNFQTRTIDLYGNMLSISPSIIFNPIEARFSPYFRMGPIFNLVKTYEDSELKNSHPDGSYKTIKREYKGNIGVGFISDIGLRYVRNANWTFYAEMRWQSFSYQPGKSVKTEDNENGVSRLSTMEIVEIEIEYVKKIGADGSQTANDPQQQIIIDQPFSSLQILIGISYYL